MSKTAGTGWARVAMIAAVAAVPPSVAQERAVAFDGADAPPAATEFGHAGARFRGGRVETEGVPGLFASGAFHYEIDAGGGEIVFDPPASELRFFFVHGFGVAPGRARAFAADGALVAERDSVAASTFGAAEAFVSMPPGAPVARVTFDGGALDSVRWKQAQADDALQFGTQVNGAWLLAEPAPYLGGQGLMFDYLPETRRLFVAWFTFGDDGAPRWFVAEGPVTPTGATLQVFRAEGGRFNAGQVQQTAVGTLQLAFEACDRATATYALPGEQRSGTLALRRARSLLAGGRCD